MATVTRIGNNYRTFIAKEYEYNTAATASWTELPDACDMSAVVNSLEVNSKTGTLYKHAMEVQKGTETATVAMTGNFSPDHSILLDAVTFDDASPRVLQASQPDLYSYTVAIVYTDDEKVDYVTGCTAESMTINGSSGEVVQYSTALRGNTITREAISGSMDGLVMAACPTNVDPFLFADVTASVVDASFTAINDFELAITNTFQSDKEVYQNSWTKNLEAVTSVGAEFKVGWNYDRTLDDDAYDNILADTLINNTITLMSGAEGFVIATEGKITNYSRPDVDEGLFVSAVDVTLLTNCDGAEAALTITDV